MIDWQMTIPITIAAAGLIFGIYRWVVHRADKRHEAHEKRFTEQDKRFYHHESRIERNERELRQTREELHRDYVRVDQMDKMMDKVSAEIAQVHHRLGGIAKDLNQVIGTIQSERDTDMKALVKEIKHVLENPSHDER